MDTSDIFISVWCISFAGLFASSEILVNISAGLLSGATIGILNSVAQYRKIKDDYFVDLYTLLKEYYKVFVVDEELLYKSIIFLREHSLEDIKACAGFKDFNEVNSDMVQRYSSLLSTFCYGDFTSLWPFDKESIKLIKKLDFEISFARGELIKFHSELLDVAEVQTHSDLNCCLDSRTLLYAALSSGVQCIYVVAQDIARRFKLTNTKEYKYWSQYSDDVYMSTCENEEYLVYGELLDEDSDEDDYDDIRIEEI